jgi:regulator of sigma E protease
LFFPPKLVGVKRGETEYMIGAIPLGGFVKITGMVRDEEIDPQHQHRAYYNQPIWKRIVVIAAGPTMNVLVALLLLWTFWAVLGYNDPTATIAKRDSSIAASQQLQVGDRVISVDGRKGDTQAFIDEVRKHKCAGKAVDRCMATTPAIVVVERDGELVTRTLTPQYDARTESMRIGLEWRTTNKTVGPLTAAKWSAQQMWQLTKQTASLPSRLFNAEQRKEISSAVGAYEGTRRTFESDTANAIAILALISLSLAIVNLFPFLPLDGGHIFWALVEGIRGRPVATATMERASIVGFALVIGLFLIGLTNDVERISNGKIGP